MPVQIRAVHGGREIEAVQRLWYRVYVEELQRKQMYADPARELVVEPLDHDSLIWAAFDDEHVVGTLRTTYGARGDLASYQGIYGIDRGLYPPAVISVTTKLVLSSAYRKSSLAYRLAAQAYRTALADGILFDFIDVFEERVPFFLRLGYRIHRREVLHPEYGRVVVMRISTRDLQHFADVRSPFERDLREWMSRQENSRSQLCGGAHGSV